MSLSLVIVMYEPGGLIKLGLLGSLAILSMQFGQPSRKRFFFLLEQIFFDINAQ